jgi:hypothetical protein
LRSLSVVVPLSLLVTVGLILLNPERFFVDDAWFYLQIAHNLAAGSGSTFHGRGFTNGYHPLWMGLSTLIALGTGLDRPAALYGTILLQAFLGILGGVFFWRLARAASLPYPTLGLAFLGVVFYSGQWYGSEAWLNMTLQLLSLLLLLRARGQTRAGFWLLAGASLGLAILARLDLIFFAGFAVLSPVVTRDASLREGLRRALLLGVACAAVVLPYLLLNLLWTGHIVPISGAIKSTFPSLAPAAFWLKLGVGGILCTLGALLGGLLCLQRTLAAPVRFLLGVTSLGAIAQGLYVSLFARWGWSTDYGYYYLCGLLCIALLLPVAYAAYAERLPSFSPQAKQRLAAGIALTAALVVPARVASNVLDGVSLTPDNEVIEAARWMNENLPADAVIYTFDAPGRLAWFSERPVLAADGLTHGFDYDSQLTRLEITAFLRERQVTHIVAPLGAYRPPWGAAVEGEDAIVLEVKTPRGGIPAGKISLPMRELLFRFSERVEEPTGGVDAGLWRWSPEPVR